MFTIIVLIMAIIIGIATLIVIFRTPNFMKVHKLNLLSTTLVIVACTAALIINAFQ